MTDVEREVTKVQDGQFKNQATPSQLETGQKHRPHRSRAMMILYDEHFEERL